MTGSVQLGEGTAWSEALWSQKFRLSWLGTFEGGQPEGEPVSWGGRSSAQRPGMLAGENLSGSEVRHGGPKGPIIKCRRVLAFFFLSGTIIKLLSPFQVDGLMAFEWSLGVTPGPSAWTSSQPLRQLVHVAKSFPLERLYPRKPIHTDYQNKR